jgi:uncharacterized protein YlxW (UPF0749 family)
MGEDQAGTPRSRSNPASDTASTDPAADGAAAPASRGRRVSAWSLGVAIVSVGAGFLLASGATASGGTDLRAERRTQLVDLISAREADVAARTDRITALDEQVAANSASTDADTPSSTGVDAALEAAAGLTPAEGPGVTVELDDAPRQAGDVLPEGVRPDDLVVHQQDVQAVVNALWASGATAMQIMDQRVISTSAVRCVGNTLILQGRVYSPPFRVTAIGDPQRLQDGLAGDPDVTAYRDWSDAVGLGYSEQAESLVRVNGYDGPVELAYAEGVR